MPETVPQVAFVIPTHNRREAVLTCLESVRRQQDITCVPVLACDGCTDGTQEAVRERYPEAVIVEGDGSWWWSGAINAGIRAGLELGVPYICLLNDDVQPAPDMLANLMRGQQAHPGALIGPVIYDANNRDQVWCAGGCVNWLKSGAYMRGNERAAAEELVQPTRVDWLPGMGTLIPRAVFDKIGMMDDRKLPQYFGDTDFGLRASKAGIEVWVWPEAKLYNDVSSTGFLLPKGPISMKTVRNVLFTLRSHAHWRTRFRFYARHCPPHLVPWQILRFYTPVLAAMAKKLTYDRLRHGPAPAGR